MRLYNIIRSVRRQTMNAQLTKYELWISSAYQRVRIVLCHSIAHIVRIFLYIFRTVCTSSGEVQHFEHVCSRRLDCADSVACEEHRNGAAVATIFWWWCVTGEKRLKVVAWRFYRLSLHFTLRCHVWPCVRRAASQWQRNQTQTRTSNSLPR